MLLISFNDIPSHEPPLQATVEAPFGDHPKCKAKVVAYRRWSKFCLISIWKLPRLTPCTNADAVFHSCKSQFWEKKFGFPIEEFSPLALPGNTIMLQHLIIQFPLYLQCIYIWLSGHLRKVKNKRKFQTFSSKSGHVREVSNIVI